MLKNYENMLKISLEMCPCLEMYPPLLVDIFDIKVFKFLRLARENAQGEEKITHANGRQKALKFFL